MSSAAAIGYVVGIIIFAWYIRSRRQQMIHKHMAQTKAQSEAGAKGTHND